MSKKPLIYTNKYNFNHNIDIADDRNYSPLHHASKNGHIGAVNTLVEKGANVNARGDQGETPLHLSVSFLHLITILKFLRPLDVLNSHRKAPCMTLNLRSILKV